MGVAGEDYSKVEITAKPLMMVVESESVDKNRVSLEISREGEGWIAVDTQPSVRGGVYTWTVATITPCKTHHVRLWLHGKDRSQASYEYPGPVQGVTQELLHKAGYRPTMVRGLEVVEVEDRVEMRWLPSPCADVYDITYQRVDDGEPVSLQTSATHATLREGIEDCSEYDYKISASTGTEYSDDTVATIITHPRIDAAASLEPQVSPTTHGLTVRWKGYEKLPCIKTYEVTVCKEGNDCPEKQTIVRDDSLEYLEFVSTVTLSPCHDYTLHIKPLYPGKEMQEKVVSFRTSAPVLSEDMTIPLHSIEPGYISWGGVECATQYLLYLKETSGLWELVGSSSKTYYNHSVTPCTEYRYGVRVVVGEEESEIVELGTPVISGLQHYDTPNLSITTTPSAAILSWDHMVCIIKYRVMACDGTECYQDMVTVDSRDIITHTIHGVYPCTDYTLHIYPVTSAGEYSGVSSVIFTTGNPAPTPPDNLDLVIINHHVVLSWARVQCATGYKIHQQLGHDDTVVEWVHDDVDQRQVSLESPEPCVTYSYSVSSVIHAEESDCCSWVDILVPPRFDNTEYLTTLHTDNRSAAVRINNNQKNKRCELELYQVTWGEQQQIIHPEDMHDGVISVQLHSENDEIKARIKYKGFENWSQWISSELPVSLSISFKTICNINFITDC